MADENKITVEKNKLVIKPLKTGTSRNLPIFINRHNKITLIKDKPDELFKNFKMANNTKMYREDVIYESKNGDFLKGNPLHKITVVNRLNLVTNSSRTAAIFSNRANGNVLYEKSSESLTKLIGQSNYDIVFSALCSVINQEIKVRGIMALLTDFHSENQSTQTEDAGFKPDPVTEEKCCQTDENCMDILYKMKQKKRIKRTVLTPYVVKDDMKTVKKVTVYVPNKKNFNESISTSTETSMVDPIPELQLNEESNDGSLGNMSGFSSFSHEHLEHNPNLLIKAITQHTKEETLQPAKCLNLNPTVLKMLDGTHITLMVKPENPFHYATPEIMKDLTNEECKKLLWYQAYIDWKYCNEKDQFGYLPIHTAVLENDLDLLRRQCLVRRNRNESLDVVAENKTPLQLSIQVSPQCTAMLLQYGADPLYTDDEQRTALHLAAEVSSDHLRAVINHCQNKAKEIFEYHELWKPEYENKSKEELGKLLLKHMCSMVDSPGYTPLMLASKIGNYTNVRMLVEASPESVNVTMPNSGSCALFLAVGEACLEAAERGNKSKVSDKFSQTITILIDNGADTTIENHAGVNVNTLLMDSSNSELSRLIANRLNSVKYFDGKADSPKNCDSYMLIKNEKGDFDFTDITKPRKDKEKTKQRSKNPKVKIECQSDTNLTSDSEIIKQINSTKREDSKDWLTSQSVIVSCQSDIKNVVTSRAETILSNIKIDSPKKEKPIILQNITLPLPRTIIDSQKLVQVPIDMKIVMKPDKIYSIKPISTKTALRNQIYAKLPSKIENVNVKREIKTDTSPVKNSVDCGVDGVVVKIENDEFESVKRKSDSEAGPSQIKFQRLEDPLKLNTEF